MTPEIREYLLELLKEAGQTDLSDEVREQLLQDLNSRLEERLTLTVMEQLSPEKVEEIQALVERNGSPEEVSTFLKTNVTNYEEVFGTALVEFRNIYLGKG